MASFTTSKTDSRAELKSTRAAGAEDLIETTRRLAKRRGIGQVAAVTGQVGDVQDVEYFPDERQLVLFAKDEGAAQAQVLGQIVVPKLIFGGQGYSWDGLIAWRATAGEILVELLDDSSQIFSSQAPVKPVHICARERVSVGAITVEI